MGGRGLLVPICQAALDTCLASSIRHSLREQRFVEVVEVKGRSWERQMGSSTGYTARTHDEN